MTKILGISGSLRKESFNTRLLNCAADALDGHAEWQLLTLHDIPLFNEDDEQEPFPERVVTLTEAIRDADGVLFGTPEYNRSLPGVLKNAIDWASRPSLGNHLRGKPYGVISASPGRLGGAFAQLALKTTLDGILAINYTASALLVAGANDVFEGEKIVAEDTTERLENYVRGFAKWVAKRQTGLQTD